MSKPKAIHAEVHNVGGVSRVALDLAPGVNVLRGRNGAGKTSAIRAISRAAGGGDPIEVRDGASKGTVRLWTDDDPEGVQLTARKAVRTSGGVDLYLAEVSPLADLIDPGLKDSDAAAKARIRALLRMVRLPVDDVRLATLCDGDRDLLEQVAREARTSSAGGDLLAAAERTRLTAHQQARTLEEEAERATIAAQAAADRVAQLREEIGGDSRAVTTSPEDARTRHRELLRKHEAAQIECRRRRELEERQSAVRETLGERPDVDALRTEEARQEQIRDDARRALQVIEGELAAVRERVFAAEAALRRWDDAQRILDQPVEGPTPKEVDALGAELVKAEELVELARMSAEIRERRDASAAAARQAREWGERAAELRQIATTVHDRLATLLEDAGVKDVTVIDGRLQLLVDGEPRDWETRLSDGQRIKAALDIAVAVWRTGLVALDGRLWSALDPAAKRLLAEEAAERGLAILTEEPTDGELRVEVAG